MTRREKYNSKSISIISDNIRTNFFNGKSIGLGTPYFPNPLPKNTFIDDTKITFSNPSKYTKNRRKTIIIYFPNSTPKHFPNLWPKNCCSFFYPSKKHFPYLLLTLFHRSFAWVTAQIRDLASPCFVQKPKSGFCSKLKIYSIVKDMMFLSIFYRDFSQNNRIVKKLKLYYIFWI